jgi:ABC-type multidrug transport system ATPase subunit
MRSRRDARPFPDRRFRARSGDDIAGTGGGRTGAAQAVRDVTAVDGIDLGIRKGEVFGLLGRNGAGKSTTVEILVGHCSRDAGKVSVPGTDPEARHARVALSRRNRLAG